LQAFLPLLEQFGSMHQHERVDATGRNHRRRGHRFAKGSRRAQDTCIVLQHGGYGNFLIGPQSTGKCDVQRRPRVSLVDQLAAN